MSQEMYTIVFTLIQFVFTEGNPFDSQGVGLIVNSKNGNFKEGQTIQAMLNWSEYTLIQNPECEFAEIIESDLPLSLFTGLFGMPGFTAYAYFDIRNRRLIQGFKTCRKA